MPRALRVSSDLTVVCLILLLTSCIVSTKDIGRSSSARAAEGQDASQDVIQGDPSSDWAISEGEPNGELGPERDAQPSPSAEPRAEPSAEPSAEPLPDAPSDEVAQERDSDLEPAWGSLAVAPDPDQQTLEELLADPYRGWNLAMFRLNLPLQDYIFFPVFAFYNTYIPYPIRDSFDNFGRNVYRFRTLLVSMLQLDFGNAMKTFSALWINTIFGVFGFADISGGLGIDDEVRTFSDLFFDLGWRTTHYFELPILGPSTPREALSLSLYFSLSPFTYSPLLEPTLHTLIPDLPCVGKCSSLGNAFLDPRSILAIFTRFESSIRQTKDFAELRASLPTEVAYDLQRRLYLSYIGQIDSDQLSLEVNSESEDPDLESQDLWGE